MGRGDALARQFELVHLLSERGVLSVPRAARELGVSVRTVYRDLNMLERCGVPVYREDENGTSRYRLLDTYRRPRLELGWGEILALALARDLLESTRGSPFHEEAVAALRKLRTSMPAPLLKRYERANKAVRAGLETSRDYGKRGALIRALRDATENQQTVELVYRKSASKRPSPRRLDPYYVRLQGSAMYVVGYCHKRCALRVFAIDRLLEVRSTGQRFIAKHEAEAANLFHGTFGPWGGESQHVTLVFIGDAATIVSEQQLHPSQRTAWLDDERLKVDLVCPLSPGLVRYIVGWANEVRVLAPTALRRMVDEKHRNALAVTHRDRASG